jgi:hypothetical protein
MRLHPKSLASTDHAPGPIIASAAPMVPNNMLAHGSPGWEAAFQSPRTAASDPETGVHKPTIRSIPVMTASVTLITGSIGPVCPVNL